MTGAATPLLQAEGLVKHFGPKQSRFRAPRPAVRAVDGIDLSIAPGESLGLVGESGSGKSTLGRLVMRLIEPTSGTVSFDGTEITGLSASGLRPYRRRMQLVFQDSVSSFNPRVTIGQSLTEPMRVHGLGSPKTWRDRCAGLLEQVGIDSSALDRYPHQFSGGQAQRIGIARALATEPDLIVCDEAVSALDVSVQAQILNLLRKLQAELGLSYLFIAHDLNVVRYLCDRVAVMYLGRLVEEGPSDDVMAHPLHPYSTSLVSSIPALRDGTSVPRRTGIPGEIASPSNPPSGCTFHPRCPYAVERCSTERPELLPVAQGRTASCHILHQRVAR